MNAESSSVRRPLTASPMLLRRESRVFRQRKNHCRKRVTRLPGWKSRKYRNWNEFPVLPPNRRKNFS
jgi:hypothetical protein